MKFTVKSSSYLYMQKIQLFKVKILTENCDYLNAINSLESNIDFCYNYIKLLSDHKFNVYIFDIKDEKNRKYLENLKKKRLFKIYQYKGFIKQNENEENKINKQNLKFKNKKSLIALNQQKLKYIEILNNINQNRTKKNINKNKIDLENNEYKFKIEEKQDKFINLIKDEKDEYLKEAKKIQNNILEKYEIIQKENKSLNNNMNEMKNSFFHNLNEMEQYFNKKYQIIYKAINLQEN